MFKGALYYNLENMTIGLAPTLRRWGQNLFRSGMVNQAASAHEDTIQPSLRCVAISASKFPRLLDVSDLRRPCAYCAMAAINIIGLTFHCYLSG